MLVFSENITLRLRYIAGFILGELLDLKPEYTSDLAVAEAAESPVIWYTSEKAGKGFRIIPAGLCEEKRIRRFVPQVSRNDNGIFLFPTDGGDFPFDIFSASFYLLSRYEEYLPFNADRHGRFPASESLAYKEGFLDIPVVNQWAVQLASQLKKAYPSINPAAPKACFQPSVDADIAWAYRNRGFYRTFKGMVRQLLTGNLKNIGERIAVLRGVKNDPYDTFKYIEQTHGKDLIIFVLAGSGGTFDLNTPVRHPAWTRLVKDLSESFIIGFHPSYYTTENADIYRKEKKYLEKITGRPVTVIRQHFLRLSFPATYQRSVAEGFTGDYSMGYSGQAGFRAGTSSPFLFYDLEKETETKLRIFPFVVMDRTLKDYLGLSPDEAKTILKHLAENISRYGGCFVPIWHNDALGDTGEWAGWKEVYEYILTLRKELF